MFSPKPWVITKTVGVVGGHSWTRYGTRSGGVRAQVSFPTCRGYTAAYVHTALGVRHGAGKHCCRQKCCRQGSRWCRCAPNRGLTCLEQPTERLADRASVKHLESEVDDMSYLVSLALARWWVSSGIERGANRLHNARVTRVTRRASAHFHLSLTSPVTQSWPTSPKSTTYNTLSTKRCSWHKVKEGYSSCSRQRKADYVKQRDAILNWAQAGPYVHEGKASRVINAGTVSLAIAGVYTSSLI